MVPVKSILFVPAIVLFFLLISVPTQAVDHNFGLKLGYNFFQGDDGWEDNGLLGEDSSYYNGRNYGLEWDMYASKVFGIRLTLEYMRQNRAFDYHDNGQAGNYYPDYQRTLIMIPFTVSAKVKIPTPVVAPYFYGGFGFYYWGVYEGDDSFSWYDDEDDLRLIQENDGFGFQIGTGMEFSFSEKVAFLLEAEFRAVELDSPEYRGEDINASSFLLTTGIMLR